MSFPLRMLCYMNSVVNGLYSSSGDSTSHFFTTSIAMNRLVRGTHASNSLMVWYSNTAVDFADLHVFCKGEERKDNISHLFLPLVRSLCEVAFLQILFNSIFPSPVAK
jgi:hypothetical protein